MIPPLFAPQIDAVIENLKSGQDLMNQKIHQGLLEIHSSFGCIKPFGDDDIRQIWIEVERGQIEDFGDYDEYKETGEVNNPDEFVELWQDYYPQKTKWYKFQTAKFRNDLYFYFGDKHIFTLNNQEPPVTESKSGWNLEFLENFVHWLAEKIVEETGKLKINPTAYNQYIRQNLPWDKRYGRIKRQDFWDTLGNETIRLDIGLGKGSINTLKVLAAEVKGKEKSLLQEMTANVFFRLCEICYDANNYFKDRKEDLSSVEKYLSMADGRDAGLRSVEADSPQAFYNWYHSGDTLGAHPWEICRGGNSSHISLFVSENAGKWVVRLAGSSIVRVEETVRMALALYENKIPFELSDAEQIVDMVSGNGFIGIVPENIVPRYCHNLFPPKDRINDFINLNFEKEFESKIIEKTQWYPLDKIELGE